MKPTPSKVVLLMSAAGLGLSWSGAALASRDSNVPASVALTFGVAPRTEPNCETAASEGWASCPAMHGELVRTIVAETAALPLPFRALDGYAAAPAQRPVEARAADGEPQPDDKAPPPETPVTARIADASGRDREADAIAMVLLDDPRGLADDAATDAEPPVALPPLAPVVGRDVRVDAREGSAANSSAGKTGVAFADERSLADAHTATDAGPAAADSESVDLVLASLAEVLGAQLDEAPSGIEAMRGQTAVPKQDTVTNASAAPEATQLVSAPPIDAGGGRDGSSLQRSSEAEEIVVAPSHSDKILMSLAALRSGEGSEPGRLGAQTKKTVVVRHTDKVLETLALFQSRKPKRTALACTGAAGEETAAAWEFREPSDETMMAGIGDEPDILLDLLPPVADRSEKPALQPAAPAQEARARAPSVIGSELVALSADKLDEVRGGFVTDGGLKISFGIERAVYLNGNLVTTTSLNIADLSKISGGQAQVTGNGTASSLALVQSGAGNVFVPGSISTTAAGTVIQNTRDNQTINTITRIDAVVNSSGIMRAINLQSSMQSAIVNSLRR